MSDRCVRWLGIAFAFIAIGSAAACYKQAAPPVVSPRAAMPNELIPPPTTLAPSAPTTAEPDTSAEVHIDVDTHGREVDVRTLLDFIARAGRLTLVYSPAINKRVRVQLTRVPVSVALATVLSLADLTLESATPTTKTPGATSVVFYQLPVNVDSLSVEAIMRRFGVGRAAAEMIVEARTQKP